MIQRLSSVRPRRAELGPAVALCLAGFGYLILRLVRQPIESMDFRYIWLAGDLWSLGENPYSSAYKDAGAIQFPTGYTIAAWTYPFHWYIPARLAAVLPPSVAFACWLGATTLALGGATLLILSAARALGFAHRLETILVGLGYACSGSIVNYALRTGQPAVLAECGVALMLFGMARDKSWYTIFGLVLAMLKPQLGLPFAAAACFQPRGFRDAFAAALLVAVASLPAFVASGFFNQLHGLLIESRNTYQGISYNTADLMPGLPHILRLITPWSLTITGSVILSSVLTGLTSWSLRRRIAKDAIVLRIGLTCAITAAVVGLHTYDLMIVLFTLPFLRKLSGVGRAAALLALALLWRPEDVIALLGVDVHWIATLQSLALLAILGAWLSSLRRNIGILPHPALKEA